MTDSCSQRLVGIYDLVSVLISAMSPLALCQPSPDRRPLGEVSSPSPPVCWQQGFDRRAMPGCDKELLWCQAELLPNLKRGIGAKGFMHCSCSDIPRAGEGGLSNARHWPETGPSQLGSPGSALHTANVSAEETVRAPSWVPALLSPLL